MLWNKCLLAASLLSAVLAVPLRSRAASAEDEEFTANSVIGGYDKRDPNPIAKDEEYFPNLVIANYENDKRDANPDVANNAVIGHYDLPATETI